MIIFYYLHQKHIPSIHSVVILCVPLYITFQTTFIRNKYFISSKVTIVMLKKNNQIYCRNF